MLRARELATALAQPLKKRPAMAARQHECTLGTLTCKTSLEAVPSVARQLRLKARQGSEPQPTPPTWQPLRQKKVHHRQQ